MDSSKLRYYIHDLSDSCHLQLFGILSAQDVYELQCCWTTLRTTLGDRKLIVDISHLERTDDNGEQWLARMRAEGAEIVQERSQPACKPQGLRRFFASTRPSEQ